MNGNFVLVLHSHLPYVLQHGRWPHGSDWLCEVAVGAYLPILDMLEQLIAEGVSPNITLNITPILLEQLASPLFKAELDDYLSNRIETCRDNEHDFTSRGQVDLARAAQYWSKRLDRVREIWNTLDKDIVGAFGRLSDAGHLEIITSAATHAYLPLLSRDASIRLQFR
ncbi:MAG: DUF1957 domain-containing protein, partial [Candidatus Omnitrophica bacterium]|nr:DUF1957 domain-containing protein [Candidatus Omnitrophota bacterium]